ncbi:MAG TPA: arginase family protein, partial [Dehalococcoidia bacterium]|nr:arginase family protein [Dehalococcoidia bacterium]
SFCDGGKFVVTLGGEHTVSVGAVRAHAARIPHLSVLVFDAHADMRDEYLGTPYNHACSIRRHLERCPVVQVGLRSASAEEAREIRSRDLPFYTPEAFRALPDGPRTIVEHLSSNVYVNIDIDAFDPSQVVGVGTPEPGGLYWPEVDAILRRVASERRIVGFDVTELAPVYGTEADAHLAAKLVYRMIGLAFGPPA